MNKMQLRFGELTLDILKKDNRAILLFAGSGIIDKSIFQEFRSKNPERILDLGISEQAALGFASGISIANKIPIFHAQAPFLVERAYEQLKIDFGYQKLSGNFVSLGGSYEYTVLGPTHHCPSDIGLLKLIPNMQIVVPGTADEFESLYKESYGNEFPTYYRLSRSLNEISINVQFGKANIIKKGKKATLIVVGPMLKLVIDALGEEDVTILYYTTLAPFDKEILKRNLSNNRIYIFEPYFSGAIFEDIFSSLNGIKFKLEFMGYPIRFCDQYGLTLDYDKEVGLCITNIIRKYKELIS